MESRKEDGQLQQRIRDGSVTSADITRRLAELAFGKANDCVRLVLEENPVVSRLELSLLSEIKRNEKGTVEIKLVDRLKALEQLAHSLGGEGDRTAEFLEALRADAREES